MKESAAPAIQSEATGFARAFFGCDQDRPIEAVIR